MKFLSIIFVSILFSAPIYAQVNKEVESKKIKSVVTNFLYWYKKNIDKLEPLPIITGFNEDYTTKTDSVVKLNLNALDVYLNNLRKSEYIAESFINNLKAVYLKVDIRLKKDPIVDYFGPIPGLEANPIFGFEPWETLDYIDKGRFSKIRVVGNYALIQFDIPNHDHLIFVLSKIDRKWLIDIMDFNHQYYDSLIN